MENLWTERDAARPAIYSKLQNVPKGFDPTTLKAAIKARIGAYKDIESLDSVAALASRLIARRYYSFRVQPGFRHFRKMFVSLCRLKEINILDLMDTISQSITIHRIDGKYNLPTLENFQHLLVRLQSFAKILIRIVICAKGAFREFSNLVKRGVFLEPATLFVCVSSQIWSICVKLCQFSCETYNALYPLFNILDEKIVDQLPSNLIVWLGDDWSEVVSNKPTINKEQPSTKFEIDTVDLDDFMNDNNVIPTNHMPENELKQVPDIKEKYEATLIVDHKAKAIQSETTVNVSKATKIHFKKEQNMQQKVTSIATSTNHIDLGETIDRNTIPNRMANASDDNIQSFENVKQIKDFMEIEDTLRLKCDHAATKHLNENEWKQFKQNVNCVIKTDVGSNAVNKFKRLWKIQIKKRNKKLLRNN